LARLARVRFTRRGKLVCALVALAVLAGCSGTTTSSNESTARSSSADALHHAGRWLVDSEGRVLLLHGINVSAKVPGPLKTFDAGDAALVASLGFSTVRLAFTIQGIMPTPGKIDADYLGEIARVVGLLGAQHIYVLLDIHQDLYGPATPGGDGMPPWMEQIDGASNPDLPFPNGYFKSPAVQRAFANFWADVKGPGGVGLQERYVAAAVALASAFKDDPDVLGYDLMNEPWPGSTAAPTCQSETGCPALERQLLAPFYTKLATAIRKVDPNHLIFAEPFLTFDYTGNSSLPAFGQPMNALSFHPYVMTQVVRAVGLADHNGDALMSTEFGATTDVATIESDVKVMDQDEVPWVFWDFSEISSPKNPSDRTVAEALAEPYPLAVAGSPESYGFDHSSRVFHLTYRTTAPPGDRLQGDVETLVEVPRLAYPSGYTASVIGARVVSRPCATHLALRATATNVSVTLAPGGHC
jgi:endoglycosylceramidase